MRTAISTCIVAFACVVGTVSRDACDLFVDWELAEQVGQNRRIADVAPGDLNSPNLWRLFVDPEMDLAPDASFGPAMLARVHSPSPSTLIPLAGSLEPVALTGSMSISRCSGPLEPRYGTLTAKVFWRRLSVQKSGTVQFRPIRRSRLSTNPVV